MPSALNSQRQLDLDVRAVRRELLNLEDKMAKKIVRRGVRAGAAFMRDEARKFVPIRYGVLRKHIYARADRSRDRSQIRAVVTIRKGTVMVGGEKINPRRYAHLVEFGTRHSKAQPFMRPAMVNESAIRDAILNKIRADLGKEKLLRVSRGSTASATSQISAAPKSKAQAGRDPITGRFISRS